MRLDDTESYSTRISMNGVPLPSLATAGFLLGAKLFSCEDTPLPQRFPEMNAWIGTSGFQYKEWKGSFYPEKLSLPKMLPFYASVFNSTEINYTFRSLPSDKTIARWSDETPADFRFSLKAPQRVTHFAKLRKCGDAMSEFRQPLIRKIPSEYCGRKKRNQHKPGEFF